MMISTLDQDHNIGNFISEVRMLTERLQQLERIANFLDQNDNLTVPRGVILQSGVLNLGEAVSIVIVNDAITRATSYHSVDTEGAVALDYIYTIHGGVEGDLLILKAENSARSVVVTDNTGNLRMAYSFNMTHVNDRIMFIFDGTNWCEISRSDNDA